MFPILISRSFAKSFTTTELMLTDVTLPSALTALGDEAFAGCSALSRVTFRSNAVLGNASLPQNFSLRAYGPVDAANLADWFESAGLMYNHYRLTLQDGEFTASMEDRLDAIEEGQRNWKEVLAEFCSSSHLQPLHRLLLQLV